MTAGQAFVKKIGPFGSALFLLLFVAFLIYCFLPAKSPADGFTPAHDTAYYSQHLSDLEAEITDELLPKLGLEAETEVSGDKLEISFAEEDLSGGKEGILKHYDESLFTFERGTAE